MKFNRFFTIFAATAAFGLAGAASGGTPDEYTWTAGASSADWDASGNWSCSGTCNDPWPGRNNHDVEVIIGQAGSFDPALNVNAKIGSLTIQSDGQLTFTGTGRLTVAGDADIFGVLTVPGDLQVGGTPSASNNGDMAAGTFEVESTGDVEVGGDFVVEPASVVPMEGLMLVEGQVELRASGGDIATVRVERGATGSKFTIEGKLVIQSNTASPFAPSVLQIGNDAGTVGGEVVMTYNAAPHEIGGDVRLLSDTSDLRVLASMTFGPQNPGGSEIVGEVRGFDDAALIEVVADSATITLTSNILFAGGMTLDGALSGTNPVAKFVNLFEVDANLANGTITLGPDLVLEDDKCSLWAATGSSATLRFNLSNAWTGSEGDYLVDNCGTLRFDNTVETTGCMEFGAGGGAVVTGASGSFDAFDTDSCGGGSCIDFSLGNSDCDEEGTCNICN